MLNLERGKLTIASLLFGLSSFTRSNGLVNFAFVAHRILKVYFRRLLESKLRNTNLCSFILLTLFSTVWSFAQIVIHLIICSLPFFLYQYYAFTLFCNTRASSKDLPEHVLNYGIEQGYRMAHLGTARWCNNKIPISYMDVQSSHWNVGFLQYYQVKQIPNFLLASPMLILCILSTFHYIKNNLVHCFTLGFYDAQMVDLHKKSDNSVSNHRETGFCKNSCFVYVVHMISLTLCGALFMHIQVSSLRFKYMF